MKRVQTIPYQRGDGGRIAFKHGMTRSPEYEAWRHARGRCEKPSYEQYPNYGGRGIRVCDRWQGVDGFQNFLADMGARPSSQHSLDRIDVDGDYEPDNCRWATPKQQANNRRDSYTPELIAEILFLRATTTMSCRAIGRHLGVSHSVPTRVVARSKEMQCHAV